MERIAAQCDALSAKNDASSRLVECAVAFSVLSGYRIVLFFFFFFPGEFFFEFFLREKKKLQANFFKVFFIEKLLFCIFVKLDCFFF